MSSQLAFCPATGLPQGGPRLSNVRGVYPRLPTVAAAHPPRRIAAVTKDLQDALQRSLRSRVSRIGVRLPIGARLGTEKRPDADAESMDVRRTSGDRELARVLAAMFMGTGLNAVVAFASDRERETAAKIWGSSVSFPIESWDSSSGRKARARRAPSPKTIKKGKGESLGFGSKSQADDSKDPDVYIVAGGGAGFLARVRSLAQSIGMDKLVIVANGNSRGDQLPIDVQRYFEDEFEAVYHYHPNPHPKWSGGVLFRKFPDGKFFTSLR